MAKIEVKTKPTYTVELTHEAAVYLKNLLQNPYMYTNPEEEPAEESILRSDLWVALDASL